MSTADELATWTTLFAARAAGESDDGLASILALSTATDLISFAGGFPDPATFPGPVLAEILGDILSSGDASALQYAPTPGLPGFREFLAGRLERLEGRRPQGRELLVTSGGIEALELLGKCFLDPGDVASWRPRPTSARSWRSGASRPTSEAFPSTTTASSSRTSSGCWGPVRGRSSCTSSRTTKTPAV
jgi:hypothetical protein